jgi:hypothetical protein
MKIMRNAFLIYGLWIFRLSSLFVACKKDKLPSSMEYRCFLLDDVRLHGSDPGRNMSEKALSDVALANVEALANEGSCCIGSKFQITPISGGWRCENDKGSSCCPVC